MTSQEFYEGIWTPYKALDMVMINTMRRPKGSFSSENQMLSMNKTLTLN